MFLDGGADALSLIAPTGDPLYRQLRPRLALPDGAGAAFAEDPTLSWHPSLAPLAELHGEGKVSVMPGDRLRPSEPVALHLPALLGGRSRGRAAHDGLARALPRPRRQQGQPAPGPLARLEPAALARHREDAGRRRRRARQLRLLGARRLGRGLRADGRHDRQARRDSDAPRSRPRGGEQRGPPVGPALRAARSVPAEGRQEAAGRARWPTRRATTPSPAASPASRRCSPPECRSTSSRCRLPAATTRTTTRRPISPPT